MKKYAGFGFLLALVLVLAGGRETLAKEKEDTAIHTGVYADEIELSGMTVTEAKQEVEDYSRELAKETLTLKIFDQQLQVSLEDLGFKCANPDVIDEAAALGKGKYHQTL